MATLADISKKISEGNNQAELNREELVGIRTGFDSFLRMMKESKLDQLEASRKMSKPTPKPTGRSRGSKTSMGDLFGLGGLTTFMTSFSTISAGIVALGASLTDLDDVIRGAFIVKTLARVGIAIKDTVKAIDRVATDFADGIKNFGKNLKNVFVFDDVAKKAFTGLVDDLRLRFMLFSDDTFGRLLKVAKASILTTMPESGGKIATQVSETLKPVTTFFTSISDNLSAIGKFLPTINFEAVKAIFVGAEEGGGILGFLSKVFKFLDPVLAPIKFLLKTVLRPFTQILLSVIDFVTGFYQGFTSADGSFMDKLTAGIEGGVKGVIKGFTEAIDMIFIEFPAWILKTLGFEKLSDNLKKYKLTDLVDPIYDAIKAFFKDPIGIGKQVMGDLVKNFFNVITDSIKGIIRSIAMFLPDSIAKKIIGEDEFEMADAQRDRAEATEDVKKAMVALESGTEKRAELRRLMKQKKEAKVGSDEYYEAQRGIRKLGGGRNESQMQSEAKREAEAVTEALERQKQATDRLAAAIDKAAGGSGMAISPEKSTELESLSSQRSPDRGATVVDARQTSGDTITSTTNQSYFGDLRSDNRRFNTDMLFQE